MIVVIIAGDRMGGVRRGSQLTRGEGPARSSAVNSFRQNIKVLQQLLGGPEIEV